MEKRYVLQLADPQATLAVAGGKGASLARLASAELPVPDGFHVTTEAYRYFIKTNGLQPQILEILKRSSLDDPGSLEDASRQIKELILQAPIPQEISDAIAQAYEEMAGEYPAVAVRSSATAEDLPELSFAGQQETYLNVEGVAEVLDNVRGCWASLWTARAIGYRERGGINSSEVALAVVVQRMVPAKASGVLFTAHPVTGRRDQAVINAAWGLGETIVGGEVTPDIVVVEKKTGRVLERETSDKQTMTVGEKQRTVTQDVPDELRLTTVLDDKAVSDLVELGNQIESLYEMPMDIEWAQINGRFAIVQARPITALPEPEAAPPTAWIPPHEKGKYIRTSIVDLFPNPLSPLFSTLGLRLLNEGTARLVEEELNAKGALPDDFYLTINDYAYGNMTFTTRQWILMLTAFTFGMQKIMKTGVQLWREEALPRYQEAVRDWEAQPIHEMAPAQLFDGARDLMWEAVHYLTIMQLGAMPLAAQSEGIFTGIYNRWIKKDGDPPAPTFLLGFDSKPIQSDKDLYDLSQWINENPALSKYLQDTPAEQLATWITEKRGNGSIFPASPADLPEADWIGWIERFQDYLSKYGHTIYDMDFVNPVPADDPTPLIEMLKLYLSGKVKNPSERQRAFIARREVAEKEVMSRLGSIRKRLFTKTLKRAQYHAPIREESIADIGLGYPIMRAMLNELGERFVAAGALQQPEEIYWLEENEVEEAVQILERGEALSPQTQVAERKAVWRAANRVTVPPQIPEQLRVLGLDLSRWLPTHEGEQTGNQIKGLGASPGKVTAPACVLFGPDDFEKMKLGDVLVATITTPAWTPLFARASAVVTDIGGPLSHGSIVAREYGIPAVLGTGVATRRIRDGQLVTVNGDAGIVTLDWGEEEA